MNIYEFLGKRIITRLIRNIIWPVGRFIYYRVYFTKKKYRAKEMVSKVFAERRPIRVAFMLYELPFWKNEALFKVMQQDNRFLPAFWIMDMPAISNPDIKKEVHNACVEYVKKNKYPYFEDISLSKLKEEFAPDYVFVVHPYNDHIPFTVDAIKEGLFCYIPYAYCSLASPRMYVDSKIKYFYRYYVESVYIQQEARKYMLNHAINTKITGLPMADYLSSKKSGYVESNRKCIIWAPHWSIRNHTGGTLDVSTFLQIADGMLKLVGKYSSQVDFVFKPHPLLKRYLYNDRDWGKERTDAYYREWVEGENTSLEEGDYVDLFVKSDAIIHDSCSFIQEYLLMNKPCMYMVRIDGKSKLNYAAQKALECYLLGFCVEDIEHFVYDVLTGEDKMATKREEFLHSNLISSGSSAVQNIIMDLLNP